MSDSNGNGHSFGGPGSRNDPDTDFPMKESYTDCAGQKRDFVISYHRVPVGFSVEAQEEGKDGDGYCFRAFDSTTPYLALGCIRGRIRRALATRHIEQRHPGVFQATHETLRGRISYSSQDDGAAFVIDGQLLTLEQLGKLLGTFEGFQFRLDVFDTSDDVP